MTGLKVQPPQTEGRSRRTVLQSSRSRSFEAGRNPTDAVHPEFDQPNSSRRPKLCENRRRRRANGQQLAHGASWSIADSCPSPAVFVAERTLD